MKDLKIEYSARDITPWGGMELRKIPADQTKSKACHNALDLPKPGLNRGYITP
jgi:hypothetical protein